MQMQAQCKRLETLIGIFFFNANVEKQENILDDTLFNIYFSNFVRSKVIAVDDKYPPLLNGEIKLKIKSKNKTFQQFKKVGEKYLILKLWIKKQ